MKQLNCSLITPTNVPCLCKNMVFFGVMNGQFNLITMCRVNNDRVNSEPFHVADGLYFALTVT